LSLYDHRNQCLPRLLIAAVRPRQGVLIALLAATLALAAATAADARRASFTVSVTGTQGTVATAADNCRDADGVSGSRSGQLNERVNFTTQRPGRVVFTTAGRKGMRLRQSTVMLASGDVTRQSTLDERGITPGSCAEVVTATGCGSATFTNWRLSLRGPFAIGIRAGSVPGGNPFRMCQNPFNGFPGLAIGTAGKLSRKAVFSRKRTLTVRGKLTKNRAFADGYTNARGTVANALRFSVVLTRR
jgi:hypothetical protein